MVQISPEAKLFVDNPNSYLLQLKDNELGVIKKSFWTWIKIHIGSIFGLFDKKTIQLDDISKKVFAEQSADLKDLHRAIEYTAKSWNCRHSMKRAIPTHALQFEKGSTFHKWIASLGAEFDSKGGFIHQFKEKINSREWSYGISSLYQEKPSRYASDLVGMPKPKGEVYTARVTIQGLKAASTLPFDVSIPRSKLPDFDKVITALGKEGPLDQDVIAEFKKAGDQHFHLMFFQDESDNCHVKFIYIKNEY